METLISIVRTLIGDFSSTEIFDDERIQIALAVAGIIVSRETSLGRDYEFDTVFGDITPDPVDEGDYDAVALFALKAACILNQNQYMSGVRAGIRVRDGSSEVDTTGSFGGYKDILNMGPCASYMALLKKITINSSGAGGRAVLSPYSSGGGGCVPYRAEYASASHFFDQYLGATV